MVLNGLVEKGVVEPRGKSRTTSDASVLLMPILITPGYLIDRRSNRKSLCLTSSIRLVVITDGDQRQFDFARIQTFRLGKAPLSEESVIGIELKGGQIMNTKISAPTKSPIANYEQLIRKLDDRLEIQVSTL